MRRTDTAGSEARRRSGLRLLGLSAVTAAVAVIAVVLAGLPVYVFPQSDESEPVDAVFVIGPATFDRIRAARAMIDEGDTTTLIVSVDDPDSDRSYVQKVCDPDQAEEVICLRPDPYTTQGEARALRDLAAENGWTSVMVLTQTPHVLRTRILFERCFTRQVDVQAVGGPRDLGQWAWQYLYQTGAFMKVALNQDC